MELGLSYSEICELTIGQMQDLIIAKGNNNYISDQYRKEKETEKRLGRWASSPKDFDMLRG